MANLKLSNENTKNFIQDIFLGRSLASALKDNNIPPDLASKILKHNGIDYKKLNTERKIKRNIELMQKYRSLSIQLQRAPTYTELKKVFNSNALAIKILYSLKNDEMEYDMDELYTVLPEYELKPEFKLIAENADELFEELKHIAMLTGEVPNCDSFKRLSSYSYLNISLWFHSWDELSQTKKFKAIKKDLKLKREEYRCHQKKTELLSYLHQKMNELGRPPVKADMKADKNNSYMQYYRYFGSYKKALALAGIVNGAKYSANIKNARKKELVDNLIHLHLKINRIPGEADVIAFGKFKVEEYIRYFKSLKNACKKAGFKSESLGVVYRNPFYSNEKLLKHLIDISLVVGRNPHMIDLKLSKLYSVGLYIKRFGTWNKALAAAGLNKPFTENKVISLNGFFLDNDQSIADIKL